MGPIFSNLVIFTTIILCVSWAYRDSKICLIFHHSHEIDTNLVALGPTSHEDSTNRRDLVVSWAIGSRKRSEDVLSCPIRLLISCVKSPTKSPQRVPGAQKAPRDPHARARMRTIMSIIGTPVGGPIMRIGAFA